MDDSCAGADGCLFILDLQPTTHPFSHGECGEYGEYGGRDNEQTTRKNNAQWCILGALTPVKMSFPFVLFAYTHIVRAFVS